MKDKKSILEFRRQNIKEVLPRIKIHKCRIGKMKKSKKTYFIIEGDPVLLGTVLPKVSFGGISPTVLRATKGRKYAVGILEGKLKSDKLIVDYGFTIGTCKIKVKKFSKRDSKLLKKLLQ